MQTITTIGFDIAKSVFQVHGVDATGQVVIRRQLKREPSTHGTSGQLTQCSDMSGVRGISEITGRCSKWRF